MVNYNLIPVDCANQDDMRKLAAEMREVCLKDVHKLFDENAPPNEDGMPDDDYEAAPTEEEAIARAKAAKEDIINSGQLRFINYTVDYRLTNVCFTLMERRDGRKFWNLSMSHANPQGPQRVADDLAFMIAGAFLEDGYEEVEAKAYWKAIRHFTKEMK